jgi:hypothetical protein
MVFRALLKADWYKRSRKSCSEDWCLRARKNVLLCGGLLRLKYRGIGYYIISIDRP